METGIKMLPVSVTMFIMSFVGARLSQNFTPQKIVRAGLWTLLLSVLVLAGTITHELEGLVFGASMSLLGVGMGLLASQLGNVVQSSVGPEDRSEAGGLQYTAQQLGSSLGTALIGAIVLGALGSAFVGQLAADPRLDPALVEAFSTELSGSIQFVPVDDVVAALEDNTELSDEAIDAVGDALRESELAALRTGLMAAALIVIGSLFIVGRIPDMSFEELAAAETDDD